ncbi:DUF2461 domain-containing protein [Pseudaestuariivita rosea]|uniref:DUF2461 domain-containing protein n=1 Tax=Pseudaestuariivita rosea TaxID=2763263 RepID=UPI001ABAC803|nr:DUF2461 domain-containing protein [Pseudaestuariivita rosea]
MVDGFEHMIDAARPFFRGLAANNEKAWFEPRKQDYVDDIRKPAEFFADLAAEDLSRITRQPHLPKVYRIYRDVRFSKDKSPYNPWLHILWSQSDQDKLCASWFFACGAEELSLSVGVISLGGEDLRRYRAFIDKWGALVCERLDAVTKRGGQISDYGAAPLKRVPKPYEADHPHGGLIRRKGLVITQPFAEDWRERSFLSSFNQTVNDLMPVWSLFDQHL